MKFKTFLCIKTLFLKHTVFWIQNISKILLTFEWENKMFSTSIIIYSHHLLNTDATWMISRKCLIECERKMCHNFDRPKRCVKMDFFSYSYKLHVSLCGVLTLKCWLTLTFFLKRKNCFNGIPLNVLKVFFV